jgi:hypothetical protein
MKITVGKVPGPSTAAAWTPEETIEKALPTLVTLDVVETPLDKVAEQLSRQLGVNVLVDKKALTDVGIDPATPVTWKVTNFPLHYALYHLLRPLEMTWTIVDGALLLTIPEEAATLLMTKVYDVSSLLVSPPDYSAGRSSDLGDQNPLFGPPSETHDLAWLDPLSQFPQLLAPCMGGGQGNCGQSVPRKNTSPLDYDSLIDSITSTIVPTDWDDVGGPCHILANKPQQLLTVVATRDVHEQVAWYLDTLRHRVETRPQIRIEAHWLWLTEPELASLLGDQGKASPSAGDVVDEAAWKKVRQQKREDANDSAGDFVEMGSFEAILKGQNGQLISGVSGRQTRVMVTLIPVVGDPPAAGAGGLMPPVPVAPPPQTPAPAVQAPAIPAPAPMYPPHLSAVGYQPVCRTIQEGGALEVRPCVVAEGKEILLDLHSRFVQLESTTDAKPQTPAAGVAAEANTAAAGVADRAVAGPRANVVQAVAAAVDRPEIHHYRLETTLRVPAGRRVLVGGLTYSEPSADEINLYLFVKATVTSGCCGK